MRKTLLAVALAVASIGAKCDIFGPSDPPAQTQVTTVTVTIGASPAPSPSPSPIPGICAPATSLTASVIEGSPIALNTEVTLEVTVRAGSTILDQDSECGRGKAPTWTAFPAASVFEFTSSATGYNPRVRARAAGTATTTVTVDQQAVVLNLRAQ